VIYTSVIGRAPADGAGAPCESVSLTWDERRKRVLRLRTSAGREVGIKLDGGPLRAGDLLGGDGQPPLLVEAAPEQFLVIAPGSRKAFALAAHFIGNRHIQAWISEDEILVREDHVLRAALATFGIEARVETRRIDDESYAVSGGGHSPHVHA